LVSGFGSGAYSAKLLAGTRQRFSTFSQRRQCGEEVLRIFVSGGRPCAAAAAYPAHHHHLALAFGCANNWRRIVGKNSGHRRQVTNVPVHHAEQGDDGGLVGGDRIEIARRVILPGKPIGLHFCSLYVFMMDG
jgi:hypothetical protein